MLRAALFYANIFRFRKKLFYVLKQYKCFSFKPSCTHPAIMPFSKIHHIAAHFFVPPLVSFSDK